MEIQKECWLSFCMKTQLSLSDGRALQEDMYLITNCQKQQTVKLCCGIWRTNMFDLQSLKNGDVIKGYIHVFRSKMHSLETIIVGEVVDISPDSEGIVIRTCHNKLEEVLPIVKLTDEQALIWLLEN